MIVKMVESATLAVSAMIAAVFNNLAIVITPLSPAIYTGYAVRDLLAVQIGLTAASAVGFALAMGLESAGYKSFKIAMSEPGWGSKLYPVAYIGLGISIAVFLKPEAALVGVVMFLLPALVYSAEAKRLTIQEGKAIEAQTIDRAADDKQALLLARLTAQKEIELAKVAHRAGTVPAVSQPAPAPSPHYACSCGREFGTVQALNAHQRFCKSKEKSKDENTN
jgi:hypothetical protein